MPGKIAPPATTKSMLPPVLSSKGFSLTFKLKGLTREYYGIMRFFGYIASTIVDMINDNKKDHEKWDSRKIARWEAGIFAGLSTVYMIRDLKDMMKYFRGTIAAEQGKDPDKMRFWNLRDTENPIIHAALRRFTMQQAVRYGTDAMFLKNLYWGLLGMAGRVTVERTLFSQNTSYDKLEKLFEDTQVFNFNLHSKERVTREYANIVQQAQVDHRRDPWDRELITSYMPLFDALADATIDKKFSMADATYVLGQLMTQRLSLEDSLDLVNKIRDDGLDSLRLEKRESKKPDPEMAEQKEPSAQVRGDAFSKRFTPLTREQVQSLSLNGPRSFGEMAEKSAETQVSVH